MMLEIIGIAVLIGVVLSVCVVVAGLLINGGR